MSIKFSIITVCYNSELTIGDTIKSVEEQTYKNYEHIIIDGKSTDRTIKLIEDYADRSELVKFISEKDTGIYNAMNKGIGLASGDLIVFLNSDDTFEQDALEIIKNNYKDDIDIIYGDTYDIEKYYNYKFEKRIKAANPEKAKKDKVMIPHNASFIKLEIMKENLYDENLKITADYKFFLKMYVQDKNIQYIPERITNMLRGGISTTNLELGLQEHIKCQKDVLGYTDIDYKKQIKVIKRIERIKKWGKHLIPKRMYIKRRYLKNGWREIVN